MTVKAEIVIVLGAAQAPMTARDVLDQCDELTTMPNVATTLSALKAEGLVEVAGKTEPAEGRALTLWRLTEAGRAVATAPDGILKPPRGG
jgi:predicted ArsR family transcriptional regulator